MVRKNNKKRSRLLIVGFFFLIVGILFLFSIPLKKIKEEVFEEMRLAIFNMNINKDNTTINNIDTNNLENIIENNNNNNNSPSKPNKNKLNYAYIGELFIPKIRLKKGFVSKDSKYNNIEYNVTIANEADYPDVSNGNFILMAHSGNAYISYFDKLYKLQIGDKASVSYNAITYNYVLTNIYTQAKNGMVSIYRNPNKKVLTLITCTHNDDTTQSIYIFEEE